MILVAWSAREVSGPAVTRFYALVMLLNKLVYIDLAAAELLVGSLDVSSLLRLVEVELRAAEAGVLHAFEGTLLVQARAWAVLGRALQVLLFKPDGRGAWREQGVWDGCCVWVCLVVLWVLVRSTFFGGGSANFYWGGRPSQLRFISHLGHSSCFH